MSDVYSSGLIAGHKNCLFGQASSVVAMEWHFLFIYFDLGINKPQLLLFIFLFLSCGHLEALTIHMQSEMYLYLLFIYHIMTKHGSF